MVRTNQHAQFSVTNVNNETIQIVRGGQGDFLVTVMDAALTPGISTAVSSADMVALNEWAGSMLP